MSTTLRVFIALFIIAHGYIHLSLSWVPVPQPGAIRTPFFPSWWRADIDPAWPINQTGLSETTIRNTGTILWVVVMVSAVVAALGIFGLAGFASIWIPALVVSSVASVLLITAYWHPWLPVGILIDLALLAGVYMKIPSGLFIQ